MPLNKPPQKESRLELLNDRLKKASAERRKLAAMEQSDNMNVQQYASRRGGFVERSIGRLQKLLKEK